MYLLKFGGILNYDKVGLIPWMQGWFNVWKLI